METPRYRIGNDLSVFWAIHNRDGSPYNLEGKEVRLFVTHPRGREEVVPVLSTLPDGTINNVIRWDCKGEDQRVLGAYTLTVEILTAEDHKEIKKDICEAFVLVGSSCSECDDDKEINIQDGGVLILSSKLDVYQIGVPKVEIGANGNWFIDGVDTGVSALGGGEGLVNKIYKETDFGGEFDPESVIDTFNAHSINALWLKLKEFAVDSPAVDDVLIYNGSLWVNESFQSLINRYGGTGSGGGGETFWYLGSDGKVHINYDIQIHGNALIEGDAASGGSGEDTPAEGTVTSILVDGYPYLPDASGVIDLSEAFKDIKVDLTDYYTITETDNAIRNALSGYATVEALSPVKTWVDSLKDYITKDENGVHISTNLIIDGDVASGGEGEETPAEGTVTSIEVDGTPYIPNTLGVIDLTDAFKNVTAFLSDYYTKEEINRLGFLTSASLSGYAKETWVNEQIKNIDLSGYATIDELSKYVLLTAASQTITGEVIIDGNLIVKGDVASGGEGEDAPAEGTVTGIRVDANTLLEPTAGIIDMTDVFANLDISDQLENYYTSGEVDAKIAGIDFSPYAKTTDVADTYATKTALSTLQSSHDTLRAEFDALDDALNDDVSGKINTWNEIKDFLDEYSGSEDLATIISKINADIAKRAFQSDFTALATRVGTAEGNITSLTNGKADRSELSKYVLLEKASQTIKGDITIEGNLVITGDVASGGEGGNTSAEGTVTGVTVSGVDYTSVEAGLLDLTELMANYALKSASTKVSVSPSLSSGKSIGVISVDGVGTTLYAPATYAWSEISEKPNALLFGGTSSQFLKADGSVDSNAYVLAKAFGTKDANTIYDASMLSLGGGSNLPSSLGYGSLLTMPYRKMTGNTTPDFAAQIFIPNGDVTKAYLYYRTSRESSWNAWRTVLDDGNYSSYALKKGAETYRLNIETPLTSNDADIYAYFQRISVDGTNISASDIGSARKGVLRLAGGGSESQLLFDHYNGALYYRNYQTSSWSDWKTIAFTDSNVASAQALKHSNGTVGAIVNSSGNVTIGSSDLAGTGAKLYVDGTARIHRSGSSREYLDISLAYMSVYYNAYDSDGWYSHHFQSNGTTRLMINGNNGNVGIGTTEPYCLLEVASSFKDINPTNIAASAFFAVNRHKDDGLFIGHDYTKKGSWIQSAYYGTEANPSNTHTYPLFLQPIGGNVGIGTTDPAYKLDVAGTGRFTGAVTMASTLSVTGTLSAKGSVEVYGSTPYIDFHFGNATDDYTSRIIEIASGNLAVYANWLPNTNNAKKLGNSDRRWSTIYGVNGDFSNAVTVSGLLTANSGATITGDVTINGNLIVSGDVASGGTGQDTPSEGSTSGVLTLTGEIPEGSNIPQSSLDAIGLTDRVIADLLIGKYHHVMYTSGITTYCFVVSGQYNSAYKAFTLHWGDDYMDEFMGYVFSLGSSGGWNITIYEI